MQIHTTEQALECIRDWQKGSSHSQRALLRSAIETQELNQMYYEQKGNEQGAARSETIITLLRQRLSDLEKTP